MLKQLLKMLKLIKIKLYLKYEKNIQKTKKLIIILNYLMKK